MATSSNPEDKSPHHHDGPEPDPFDLPESKKPKGPDYDLIAGVGKLVCYPPERDGQKTLRDVVHWGGMWVPPNEELLKEYVDCYRPEYRKILTDYYHMLQKTLGFEVLTFPNNARARLPFQGIEPIPDNPGPEWDNITRKLRMCHREAVRFLENLTGNKYESHPEDIVSANSYMYSFLVFFITFKATNMSSTGGAPRPETFQAAVGFMFLNFDHDCTYEDPNDYDMTVYFIRLKPKTS